MASRIGFDLSDILGVIVAKIGCADTNSTRCIGVVGWITPAIAGLTINSSEAKITGKENRICLATFII
ncbi:MAG: hypothetical protein HC903_32490 [Methylacidiphilales bacterium]|nr:hypothetical protein [Candidatus Methylacidiphilales bacterium]NJR19425.1 hypothetical protein [Calothrix sp. CSU_2_0]